MIKIKEIKEIIGDIAYFTAISNFIVAMFFAKYYDTVVNQTQIQISIFFILLAIYTKIDSKKNAK